MVMVVGRYSGGRCERDNRVVIVLPLRMEARGREVEWGRRRVMASGKVLGE